MANVLNVSQPVTGQENINKIRPQAPNESLNQVYQVTDPTRVVKTQDQSVYKDRQADSRYPNLDSNFDKFLGVLRSNPGLAQTYTELFFSKMGNLVNSGIDENFTNEISKFLELIKMDEGQLLEMLKGQQGQNVKFSGPFFDILRQLVNSSGPNDLKVAILDFLKKYDSLTSSKHILNNIMANIRNISASIPAAQGGHLARILEKLSLEEMMGNNPKNLEVLKNEVMPFLARYISMTKDLGGVRDLIAILTLNVARYESGTKESFMQSLRELASYSELSKALGGINIDDLAALLAKAGQNQGNELVDRLISIISKGMDGDAGLQSKAVFQNMATSILLNESVYMPLLHYTLPADVYGGMFFSELWIDPNAGKGQDGEEGRAVKLLVKFDIKDVGFFETIIFAQNKTVDMELYYPDKYKDREIEMKDALTEIMAKNELTFRSLFLAKVEKPKSVTEVFPKIYERRNAINVSI